MGTQLLIFPLGPQDQVSIQFAHGWVERRTIVAPVILEPTPDDRIEHPRQVFDGFITALWQVPASKCVANGLRCLVRNRRTEIDEELTLAILHQFQSGGFEQGSEGHSRHISKLEPAKAQ